MRKMQKICLGTLTALIFVTFIPMFFKLNTMKIRTYFIRLDMRKANDLSETLERIAKEIPYLPIEYITDGLNGKNHINASCAQYPTLLRVQIHNDYWQEFQNQNVDYYIYGAYLDNRKTVVSNQPTVRILTMINFISPQIEDYSKMYCQLWYDEQWEPLIVPATELHRLWDYEWGYKAEQQYGHLISCDLPKEHNDWIPHSVSLVASPCDNATNNVRVTYQRLRGKAVKKKFAVCLKALDFPQVDLSTRLVEYVETLRSLGADKIVMYNLQVHPNMTKVLKYYADTGFIELRPFSFSLKEANLPEYRHLKMTNNPNIHIKQEVIPYNDCFYRNMYQYEYVVNIDIDEIIMPLGNLTNWYDLMKFGESITDDDCNEFGSYCARCVYFPRYPEKPRNSHAVPAYFYMLQHIERVRDHLQPDLATKCFHNTDRVISTHNHVAFHVASEVCLYYSFDANVTQLQHYREPDIKETLDDPVVDISLWRIKDEIIERSMKVFKELQFFEEI